MKRHNFNKNFRIESKYNIYSKKILHCVMYLDEIIDVDSDYKKIEKVYSELYDKIFHVHGWRTNCVNGLVSDQEIICFIDEKDDGKAIFKIFNGVTGYESYYLESLKDINSDTLAVCSGTKCSYDKLEIDFKSAKEILEEKCLI